MDRTQAARSRSCRPLDLDRHRRPHPTPGWPRPLAADLRRPWEKPLPANKLTAARVRRGFRNIRATTPSPARAPKPSHPSPERPTGSKTGIPSPATTSGESSQQASHTPDPPTTKAPNPGERFDYKLRPPPRDKRDNQEPSRSGEGCHVNQSSAGPQARTESERPHGSDAHPEPR